MPLPPFYTPAFKQFDPEGVSTAGAMGMTSHR